MDSFVSHLFFYEFFVLELCLFFSWVFCLHINFNELYIYQVDWLFDIFHVYFLPVLLLLNSCVSECLVCRKSINFLLELFQDIWKRQQKRQAVVWEIREFERQNRQSELSFQPKANLQDFNHCILKCWENHHPDFWINSLNKTCMFLQSSDQQ